MKINLNECVKDNVTFSHYHRGNLWYKTVNGQVFPVPVLDAGNATFLSVDKGIFFMRYMQEWNNTGLNRFETDRRVKGGQIYKSNNSGNTFSVHCLNAKNRLTLRRLDSPGTDFSILEYMLVKEYTLVKDSE